MMMMMPIQQKSMEEEAKVQTVTIILRDDSALFTSGLKESSCNCQKKTVADLGTFTLLQPW